jgi:hypothetical protein
MKLRNLNPLQLFIVAVFVASASLAIYGYVNDHIITKTPSIFANIGFGVAAITLFVLGAVQSIKGKYSTWAAINILAVILIVAYTVWISVVLYAFRDFRLVLPD